MADPARGRSPSAGRQSNIRHTPSPSPHHQYRSHGLGLDQNLGINTTTTFANTYGDPTLGVDASFAANDFLNTSQSQQDSFTIPSDIAQHTFLQAQSVSQPVQQGALLGSTSDTNNFSFDATGGVSDTFSDQFFNDTTSGGEQGFLDPQLLGGDQQTDVPIDPNSFMNNMTTQHQSPTPPHLLQGGMDRRSVSPHVSPSMGQGAFHPPRHSRNTSLDPSSAAYPQGLNPGWGEGQQFSGHRRTPSDAYSVSDVSSTHNSPFLPTSDSFEAPIDHHSPLLNAQQDPAMFSNMAFENINLSEAQAQQHISPIPSPHISPRISPHQQQLPQFTSADSFGLAGTTLQNPYINRQDVYQPNQESFPSFQHNGSIDMGAGQASAMSPPEINIQPAPPSRQASFEPNKEVADGALSPPERSRSRNQNRIRAISDPFHGGSRPGSPANGTASTAGNARNSLSPNSARAISRSPSPSSRGAVGNRRSSTSSVPNRDYILDLADPQRPASNIPGESTSPRQRTQKHPATFQCPLCPKRFTRAYNLRSHLRTHTDERPFVCNVCNKAFARQHDRKRHEGLHSGEKRFVCRGNLKNGENWGCGRKFARADALGRHFRSEAGRICIKPLLDEEAAEKGGWDAQNPPDLQQQQLLGAGMQQQSGMLMQQQQQQSMAPIPFQLPQVLYQQFPMLQGMNWDAMPAGNDDMEEISGRSSFDASSGGEDYDDGSYGGHGMAQGWASDQGGY